jgi:hypothetical protein
MQEQGCNRMASTPYKFSLQEWLRDVIVYSSLYGPPCIKYDGLRAFAFIVHHSIKGGRS